ncbi:hypothetical protein ORV05_12960 [Amycolatopsis cynarae]|uniref:Beta-ketoacyl-[acyl-carrier-protein] synthase III N-terminal domain-containing protein n=1 Tax=Amycolatopsis cynarae TaxID=2995223 RepID=A0ABY7B8G1_9PSEU|nr:hypothetical protein [Amycolatopsis sp. HUAS 11-8]WAL68640.1 hypothetical protein ORV05_12960 [Amycolatopsis sp. HUAS 11-8]
MDGTVFLRGPRYVLGEEELDHTELPDLAAKADEYGLAPDAGLWGWGSVFRTTRGLDELAVDAGTATLRATGTSPADVDALVFCSTFVPGRPEGHGTFLRTVLTGIGLGDVPVYGLSLNRCVNLLAGIDVASSLVAARRYRRILVVTADRVFDEADRITGYALFSDGAAGCLITGDGGGDNDDAYEVLGCANAQETASLDWSAEISSDLARQVNESLLGPLAMKVTELDVLLHANIFLPVLVMKERQAGFSRDQLNTANVTRVGHCFAADPVLNLADLEAAGGVRPGGHYLLASSIPGSRLGVLLRKPAHEKQEATLHAR